MQSPALLQPLQQPQPRLKGDHGQSLDSSELLLEVGSARGGNPVQYGCSLSSMSYMTFAMISIYTMINVNNVSKASFLISNLRLSISGVFATFTFET